MQLLHWFLQLKHWCRLIENFMHQDTSSKFCQCCKMVLQISSKIIGYCVDSLNNRFNLRDFPNNQVDTLSRKKNSGWKLVATTSCYLLELWLVDISTFNFINLRSNSFLVEGKFNVITSNTILILKKQFYGKKNKPPANVINFRWFPTKEDLIVYSIQILSKLSFKYF